jgi:2-dehydropantoate 2-reductase
VRVIVYGAGAIGGAIGGRLAEHGHDVVLIARGAHHDAIAAHGLTLASPDRKVTLPVPVVSSPEQVRFGPDDVVVLGVKGQDTIEAVRRLAAVAPTDVPIICAQNGIENERVALRSFRHVHAMCVMCPATHLEPGVVVLHSDPVGGMLDVGRYPTGVDDTTVAIASALASSGFSSEALPEVMRLKLRKLIMNLGNAVDAACGPAAAGSDLLERAKAEGEACLAAAGLDVATVEEDLARRGDLLRLRPVDGRRREGGSSWQSLQRGGSIEADLLNGEIVLLGRLHGVPTPVNEVLQETANRMAREGAAPGSLPIAELERAVEVATAR